MVEENKVDTAAVAGTGKDGRITKGDVIAHLEKPAAPAAVEAKPLVIPAAPAAASAPPRRRPMARARSG